MASEPYWRMWTVYNHPEDMPCHYVARLHKVGRTWVRPTDATIATNTLDEMREALIVLGLACFPRDPSDDPAIIETWLDPHMNADQIDRAKRRRGR